MACQKLIGDGSNADIWNLEGGISAWKSAGLEVISK
jgi:rhodanese-related sulfurtransferase